MKVYTRVPVSQCRMQTGKNPIKLRWIDTRKSTGEIRSRLVAKEFKTEVDPSLYAATPPGECLRLLLSQLAMNEKFDLMYSDVSRAYFYAQAVRPVYVKLPAEDTDL